VGEETSLDADTLEIERVDDYYLEADKDYPKDRHTFYYKASLKDMDFQVFEGEQAEAYTLEELLTRQDIAKGVQVFIKNMKG
jgi:hypothetical protein